MTPTSPHIPAAHHRKRTGLLSRFRQLAWTSVPIWSLTLLAFAPFLWLAIIRRRPRDWAVFAAYLAAVVLELVIISIAGPKGPGSGLAGIPILLVMGAATVHTLIAFRPGSALPSWRDAHSIRTAAKLPAKREKIAASTARQEETRNQATAARAVVSEAKQAGAADRTAARAVKSEAKRARAADKTAARAARAQARQVHKAEKTTAHAAAIAGRAQVKQARKTERNARNAAALAARLAEPRYGWVETRPTYRGKTIFGNRRSETIVSLPSQRNARRRTRQHGGVWITEEWRRLD